MSISGNSLSHGLARRQFLRQTAGALVTCLASISQTFSAPVPRPCAVAFDALAIFDPRPVYARVERCFPEHGPELSNLWRSRQFEYTWLRALSRNYADFWTVTEEALVFAGKSLKLELTVSQRALLMGGFLELRAWPDAQQVLAVLRQAGFKLALLSNFTAQMLKCSVANAKLEGVFEHLLSTHAVRTYKPDPRAYQLAPDAFRLRREQIAFVAFAGWDAVGARRFGYRTLWANRQNLPIEELGVVPDATSLTLGGLAEFVGL